MQSCTLFDTTALQAEAPLALLTCPKWCQTTCSGMRKWLKLSARMNALGLWPNLELGALQHVFKVQISDRVCQTRDAEHTNLPCLHHI